jgi:DNA repair protein RadC
MPENNGYISIKNWSEDDRPREKLIAKGKGALSDAELLAIILGSGYKDKSAVDVAKTLLQEADNDIGNLHKFTIKQLTRQKGIGNVKAINIVAALELGRRRKTPDEQLIKTVTRSKDAYDYMYKHLSDLDHEEFYIILLKRNNTIIKQSMISTGGVSGTQVDPKLIFKIAVEELAPSIILCHNHPSGNKRPSDGDISITNKIKEAGKMLDISVLDHIIFTNDGYYSFADEGIL